MHAPILITSCTKTKTVGSRAYIPSTQPLFPSQKDLTDFWVKTVQAVPTEYQVQTQLLYAGRSFKRALLATSQNPENLYIASAGLGLIHVGDMVAPYELTISSAAPNRVSKQIAFGGFDSGTWWQDVNQGLWGTSSPIADLVQKTAADNRIVVLCLAKEYLKMVLPDLMCAAPEVLSCVRFIGNDLDEVLPIHLFDYFMPYDARINTAADAMSGSRIDFGIRAAIHFIGQVLPAYPHDITDQKNAVLSALQNTNPAKDGGVGAGAEQSDGSRKATDEEIINLVKGDWGQYHGRKIMLLRVLREKHRVKCSTQRFDKLYEVVRP